MPTIAALNIKVAMDSSQVAAGSAQVRKDVARLNTIVRQAKTDTQKYEEAKGALVRRLEAGQITMKKFKKLLAEVHMQYVAGPRRIAEEAAAQAKANEQHRQAAVAAKNHAAALQRLSRQVQMYGQEYRGAASSVSAAKPPTQDFGLSIGTVAKGAVAAAGAIKLVSVATDGLRAAFAAGLELERFDAAFKVYTGSAEDGTRLMAELKAMAGQSTISFDQLGRSAQTMLGFGVDLDTTLEMMKRLGDVSAGDTERFQRLSYAMAQVASTGRLQGDELRQLVDAGFNPLAVAAQRSGKNVLDFKKQMEAGGFSFAMTLEQLRALTEEGGRAFGAMNAQMQTAGGSISRMWSEMKLLGGETFRAVDGAFGMKSVTGNLAGDIADIAAGIRKWVEGTKEATEATKKAKKSVEETKSAYDALVQQGLEIQEQKEIAVSKQIQQLMQERDIMNLGEEYVTRRRLAEEGATQAQIDTYIQLQKQNEALRERQELAEKNRKEMEQMKEEAQRAFETNVASALEAARRYYEEERKKAEKIRQDIAKGLGGDFELGSAEAQKFFADQANARFAAVTDVPQGMEPTQDQILEEARKQFLEAQKQSQIQTRQEEIMKQMLVAFQQNGFQRLR